MWVDPSACNVRSTPCLPVSLALFFSLYTQHPPHSYFPSYACKCSLAQRVFKVKYLRYRISSIYSPIVAPDVRAIVVSCRCWLILMENSRKSKQLRFHCFFFWVEDEVLNYIIAYREVRNRRTQHVCGFVGVLRVGVYHQFSQFSSSSQLWLLARRWKV